MAGQLKRGLRCGPVRRPTAAATKITRSTSSASVTTSSSSSGTSRCVGHRRVRRRRSSSSSSSGSSGSSRYSSSPGRQYPWRHRSGRKFSSDLSSTGGSSSTSLPRRHRDRNAGAPEESDRAKRSERPGEAFPLTRNERGGAMVDLAPHESGRPPAWRAGAANVKNEYRQRHVADGAPVRWKLPPGALAYTRSRPSGGRQRSSRSPSPVAVSRGDRNRRYDYRGTAGPPQRFDQRSFHWPPGVYKSSRPPHSPRGGSEEPVPYHNNAIAHQSPRRRLRTQGSPPTARGMDRNRHSASRSLDKRRTATVHSPPRRGVSSAASRSNVRSPQSLEVQPRVSSQFRSRSTPSSDRKPISSITPTVPRQNIEEEKSQKRLALSTAEGTTRLERRLTVGRLPKVPAASTQAGATEGNNTDHTAGTRCRPRRGPNLSSPKTSLEITVQREGESGEKSATAVESTTTHPEREVASTRDPSAEVLPRRAVRRVEPLVGQLGGNARPATLARMEERVEGSSNAEMKKRLVAVSSHMTALYDGSDASPDQPFKEVNSPSAASLPRSIKRKAAAEETSSIDGKRDVESRQATSGSAGINQRLDESSTRLHRSGSRSGGGPREGAAPRHAISGRGTGACRSLSSEGSSAERRRELPTSRRKASSIQLMEARSVDTAPELTNSVMHRTAGSSPLFEAVALRLVSDDSKGVEPAWGDPTRKWPARRRRASVSPSNPRSASVQRNTRTPATRWDMGSPSRAVEVATSREAGTAGAALAAKSGKSSSRSEVVGIRPKGSFTRRSIEVLNGTERSQQTVAAPSSPAAHRRVALTHSHSERSFEPQQPSYHRRAVGYGQQHFSSPSRRTASPPAASSRAGHHPGGRPATPLNQSLMPGRAPAKNNTLSLVERPRARVANGDRTLQQSYPRWSTLDGLGASPRWIQNPCPAAGQEAPVFTDMASDGALATWPPRNAQEKAMAWPERLPQRRQLAVRRLREPRGRESPDIWKHDFFEKIVAAEKSIDSAEQALPLKKKRIINLYAESFDQLVREEVPLPSEG